MSSAATALATALPILAGCAGTYDRDYEGAAYYAEPGAVVTVSTFYEYHDGAWAYTDYGWTWISDEPWGWATCHYGRWWLLDPA